MRKLFIASCLLFTLNLQAQDCSCSGHLEWLITTFSENDAGFQLVVDKKGEAAYLEHNETFRAQAAEVSEIANCGTLLYQWLLFFRNGHHGIVPLQDFDSDNADEAQPTPEDIRAQYRDTETIVMSDSSFLQYLSEVEEPSLEGVWKYNSYVIGVIKDIENPAREYVGFILEADSVYWMPNQVKIEWPEALDNGEFSTIFYMRDHSKREFNSRLLGNNILKTDYFYWERLYPEYPADPSMDRYLKSMQARSAFIEPIDDDAVLLRIPSFNGSNQQYIDSILAANHDLISSRPILMIDIRNNGGGSDRSYSEILPYLYTNPIRIVGLEFYSTTLNNSRMLSFANNADWDEESRQWAQEAYDKLSRQIGEFVNLGEDGEQVSIVEFDTVATYPERVGILMNENCASTSEQFLLAAKQSQKVKLFGVSTAGVLDISNQLQVDFPCGTYELYYSLSKSFRIPDFAIDDIGIQPDFLMNKFIMDEEWLDIALKTLR